MICVYIQMEEYVVRYLQAKYKMADGTVVLPEASLVMQTLINSTTARPRNAEITVGNLPLLLKDRYHGKNMRMYNYLTPRAEKHIAKLARLEFDMDLHIFMAKAHYTEGKDYKDAATEFHQQFRLGETITEEALLKKHLRWKTKRAEYKPKPVQMEIEGV